MRVPVSCALLLAALLAGCGVGAGGGDPAPSQAIDETRATWQVLDLETGQVQPAASIAEPGGATYRDRRIAFRRLPSGPIALGSGAFAHQADEVGTASVGLAYLATVELTRAQWRRLAGSEPWTGLPGNDGTGDDLPALGLTPEGVAAALAAWNRTHSAHLALPAPAEWEAAARAGAASSYAWGEDHRTSTVAAYAVTWETGLAAGAVGPRPVGGRLANAWGFHDLCGNAWELVADGSLRGGSWADPLSLARPGNRLATDLPAPAPSVGVRLAYRP